MRKFLLGALLGAGAYLLWRWHESEIVTEFEGMVHLQSEHDHFHMHVDLPPGFTIEPGDTIEILEMPNLQGHTQGEVSYPSRIRFHQSSWLRQMLIKRSSLVELNELVEHP